ncbi:MAG: ribonuclease III [Dehalococcoidia bacterium]
MKTVTCCSAKQVFDMADLDSVQSIIGVTFTDVTYLEQSLMHRSYLNENNSTLASNERLEFLGDALLGFVIAEELYSRFPELPEGDLTKLRSLLVRTETLARVAGTLNMGDYLYLGKGEDESGGRHRQRNLAGTLEAVIGAVFIDQGFEVAKDFILRILKDELEQITTGKIEDDPKSRLQEVIQSKQQLTPVYRVVDIEGPEHGKIFTVEVFAGETLLGQGNGKGRRIAEREAARDALDNLEKGEELD